MRNWGFALRQSLEISLFSTVSRPAARPAQTLIQHELEALSPEAEQQMREAGHSPLFSVGFKNAWSYTSTPYVVFMA
jgi:hypothetical protein